jgi:hypothetical protein
VPQENLLAYMASSTSFTTPPPIVLWDQTLWSLGTAVDGRISGQAGEAYTTHWAYMLPYDPESYTSPDPLPDSDLTSTEWAWTPGTTWAYQSDQLFGPVGIAAVVPEPTALLLAVAGIAALLVKTGTRTGVVASGTTETSASVRPCPPASPDS